MRIVVLGGVAAGMSAASQAKRRTPDADVIVFESGHDVSYGACGMPYKLAEPQGVLDDLVAVTAQEFRNERKIDLRLGHEATAIDTEKRVVTVRGPHGVVREPYDALVIATGARAIRPELEGIDLPGVFLLRTLEDGRRIKGFLASRSLKRAVVLGSGYVGLEMVETLKRRGLSVELLEQGERILPSYEPPIGALVVHELKAQGVTLHVGKSAKKIITRSDGLRVVTDDEELRADLVLVATGVRPNSELAKAAGITLGAGGAIAVDAGQRTSAANVYAAGDCAEAFHRVLGAPAWIPLGPTANKQGKIAGANASGANEQFRGIVGTAAFKLFSTEVGRTGLGPKELEKSDVAFAASTSEHEDHAPSASPSNRLTTVLFHEVGTGRLLGAQMAGRGVVGKRIDVLATALYAGLGIDDLAQLDLSYAPPIAPVYDPVLIAGTVALKAAKK